MSQNELAASEKPKSRSLKLPRISLAHGDVSRNAYACRRWFKVVAWALERHPDGLFPKELEAEYKNLCKISEKKPYNNEGDFQNSLRRQLHIALAMCKDIGWISFRFEIPTRVYPMPPGGREIPLSPEHLWTLTNSGKRVAKWSDHKIERALYFHLLKAGAAPIIAKFRVPLAVASGAIGIAKIASNWGHIQTVLEGAVAIAGAFVLALIRPASMPPSN
jgi:hypothetical protein